MTSEIASITNPNCAACSASLRLFGDALDPDEVSRLLGVEPTDAATKGLATSLPNGKSRTTPTGRWALESRAEVDSDNLEEHVAWLLDRLEAASVAPLAITGVERADIFCYWESATGTGGPEFSPELLARLARLRLKLGFDIYFNPT